MASTSSRQTIASQTTLQNRQFWTDFFLLYESLPTLWDMRNPLYKERSAKLEAYDMLVEKLREIEPSADREDVLRKINIFRTNYRRECSRINTSNIMGKQYKTTLWYFDLLNFLQTQEYRKVKRAATASLLDGEKCIMRRKRDATVVQCKSHNLKSSLSPASSSQQIAKKARMMDMPQIIQEDESVDYDDGTQHYEEYSNGKDEMMTIEDLGIMTRDADAEVRMTTPEAQQEQQNHHQHQQQEQPQQQFQNGFQTFALQRFMQPKIEESIESQNQPEYYGETYDEYINEDDDVVVVQDDADAQEMTDELANGHVFDDNWPLKSNQSENHQQISAQSVQTPKKIIRNFKVITPKSHSVGIQPIVSSHKNLVTTGGSPGCGTSVAADILAKSWAIQYDEMSTDQKIYARKAIADILFEGCIGNLGRDRDNVSRDKGASVIGATQQQATTTEPFPSSEEDAEAGYVYASADGNEMNIKDWIAKMK